VDVPRIESGASSSTSGSVGTRHVSVLRTAGGRVSLLFNNGAVYSTPWNSTRSAGEPVKYTHVPSKLAVMSTVRLNTSNSPYWKDTMQAERCTLLPTYSPDSLRPCTAANNQSPNADTCTGSTK
jgi:hypothetical protein